MRLNFRGAISQKLECVGMRFNKKAESVSVVQLSKIRIQNGAQFRMAVTGLSNKRVVVLS